MNTPLSNSLINRSRLEQLAVFKELRRSSSRIRKLNLLQNILKLVVYFLLLYFVGFPLIDRIGSIWFVVLFVIATMLVEEFIWRLLLLPALESKRQRQVELPANDAC